MAKIVWTEEAEKWLGTIFDHISEENPEAAYKVVNGIYAKAQILLQHPRIGYLYEHEVEEEIRILLYGHYRITYLLRKNDEMVILGVFHGALEIENYLHM
ncbi:MAG: type II toxin-antitoxin system RelE/ParE family toxin [Gammaproteobacteria bacterium]|nr:type II toxin-antitoxin system RelE/ParE family toxin [Gammaproteobacteria bacterium]MDH5694736.1 type II toxin-antitoxin system RelE/ParE family toxin [Gammaproteobacteria bacterium]